MRRPLYVLLFLALLAAPQAYALFTQFRLGFRPFRAPPTRVALSWDMFAIRIERCDVLWDPPLPTPDGPLYRLHQRALPLEWDFSLNTVEQYQTLAAWACENFHATARATVLCFTPEGKEVTRVVDCR